MNDGKADGDELPLPRRRRRNTLVIGLGLTGIGVLALWSQRTPIATSIIDRELAKRGVPARYKIVQLDTKGATLSGLVLGDPAHPDLRAGRVRIRIGWGLAGASISGIMLNDVLVNGRLDKNGLNLGVLDKLRAAPSGGPFRLPEIEVRLHNVRIRLASPAGALGISADGMGYLNNGFAGRIAMFAPSLNMAGCDAHSIRALLQVGISNRKINVRGPIGSRAIVCGKAATGPVTIRVAAQIPEAFDRAEGQLQASGRDARLNGEASLATYVLQGGFKAGSKPSVDFNGAARWQGLSASDHQQGEIMRWPGMVAGTPLAPVAAQLARSLARAANETDGSAQLALSVSGGKGRVSFSNAALSAKSGARLFSTGRLISLNWPDRRLLLDGKLNISGGGLPSARLDFQPQGEDGWQVLAGVDPYQAGTARLALNGLRAAWNGSYGRISGIARLSGPIGQGHIDGLVLPIDAGFGSDGSFRLGGNRRCIDITFSRMNLAGVRLGKTLLPLCGRADGVMIAADGKGRLAGEISVQPLAINGALTGSAFALKTGQAKASISGTAGHPVLAFGVGASSFAMRQPSGETRFAFDRIEGDGGIAMLKGRLVNAGGNLAGVPLLLDQASGRWTYANGTLALDAPSVRIRDATAARRFNPIAALDAQLTLNNGQINGTAKLARTGRQEQLALLTLKHDLGQSRGNAVIDVPKVDFGDNLQPENLTPLTLGLIANVGGDIRGQGNIRWNGQNVTSSGVFKTDGIGFSAAFGQVHNITGQIVFDDLLGMTTPPGQTARLGELNTGVSVKDGVINYQLLPDQHVKVEGGHWPFAGGELILEPTTLDFSKPSDRIFTLDVNGLDAADFIQQFDFKNFAVTGRFDGTLPLLFNEKGGRIVGGKLVARAGGGTLAYVGEVSDANLGGAGKIAFDALKSLKYNALAIEMDGELDGEIISSVLFSGTNQTPVNPTGSSIPVRATGLPFKFNITVRAPFRSLLNTAQSFSDVRTTVHQALPAEAVPVKP